MPIDNMKIIGIAGGSGSGKTTLVFNLADAFPDKVTCVYLDDYFKFDRKDEVPIIEGMRAWDHLDAVDFEKLIGDLDELVRGNVVHRPTKNERDNPNYAETRERVPRTIEPKPYILVEGFLALYNERVRAMFDDMVYLDIDPQISFKRRTLNKLSNSSEYFEKVFMPMHIQYVDPTKHHASHVVDVSKMKALD